MLLRKYWQHLSVDLEIHLGAQESNLHFLKEETCSSIPLDYSRPCVEWRCLLLSAQCKALCRPVFDRMQERWDAQKPSFVLLQNICSILSHTLWCKKIICNIVCNLLAMVLWKSSLLELRTDSSKNILENNCWIFCDTQNGYWLQAVIGNKIDNES